MVCQPSNSVELPVSLAQTGILLVSNLVLNFELLLNFSHFIKFLITKAYVWRFRVFYFLLGPVNATLDATATNTESYTGNS